MDQGSNPQNSFNDYPLSSLILFFFRWTGVLLAKVAVLAPFGLFLLTAKGSVPDVQILQDHAPFLCLQMENNEMFGTVKYI